MVQWCCENFQSRGVLLSWIIVGQEPTVLVVGAGGGCLDIFVLSAVISHFYFPPSGRRPDIDCNTAQRAVKPKQPTNQNKRTGMTLV